jgi:membrane-bound inhibitor of C-type lysozyme
MASRRLKIEWSRVTWYSKLAAIALFGSVFAWGFYLGLNYQTVKRTVSETTKEIASSSPYRIISTETFSCLEKKTIDAEFFKLKSNGKSGVTLALSDSRRITLMQTSAASGAYYANSNNTVVFWNKGTTAFLQEKNVTTYRGCTPKQ